MNKKGMTFNTTPGNVIFAAGILLFVGISFYSCRYLNNNATSLDVPSPKQIHSLTEIDSSPENFSDLKNRDLVFQFYRLKNFNVVWLENSHLTSDADSLLIFIEYIKFYGLQRQHYNYAELRRLKTFTSFEKEKQQRFELTLTDAYFSMAHDLTHGLLPKDQNLNVDSDSVSLLLLNEALTKRSVVSSLKFQQPKNENYTAVQSYLQKLLTETDSITRQKFFNGLEDDTAALTRKIRTLELNMHRWRRDRDIKGRYLLVNIPEYNLKLYDKDSMAFESKIIVGTESDQTPVLNGVIRSFTVYPFWRVPRRIAVNELLPQIIQDSSYLSKHHFELIDASEKIVDPMMVDFSSYHKGNFPFILRQKEGMINSLGLIKFNFQNPYAVFLHDTNAKLLFDLEERSLSHGCVRVEKALELTRHLLADNNLVTAEDLDQYLELRKQITIGVNPLPIFIRYYTCVLRGEEVKFLDDVYGLDDVEGDLLTHDNSFFF